MENKTSEIFASLQAVNDELVSIGKDSQGFNYKFRGIDDVLNALGPLFKKYKILTKRRNVKMERTVHLRDVRGKETAMNTFLFQAEYVFVSSKDGSEFVTEGFGVGEDKGDKDAACAISNSYKYVLFEMFNIPTLDQVDSDMKTATDNGVTEAKLPPKKQSIVETTEVKKPASFRQKKVAQPTGEL